MTLPALGDVIAGKYRLVRTIGEGGMGVVFEATHVRMQQRVAIKVLQPSVAQLAEVVSRFHREARAAGQLRGGHVARVIDVDVTQDRLPYMVMEYLEGHDLQTELERRGSFPMEEAIDYVLQACAGIAEAHDAGIVHRDLKPSNLFLCVDHERRVVKILDFGISKMLGEASKLTSTELTIGTPLYMSPEQVRSAKNVDARTDVWALGIILFELLTGRPPWVGSGPSVAAAIVTDDPPPLAEFRRDVPAELEAALHLALAKKPGARFPDVRALAAALAPFAAPSSRASVDSALRPSRVVPVQPTSSSPELARAPTMPRYIGAHDVTVASSEPSGAPSVERRRANITTAGWATGAGQKGNARRASKIAFATALLFAIGALGVAGAVALSRRPAVSIDAAAASRPPPPVDTPQVDTAVSTPSAVLPGPSPEPAPEPPSVRPGASLVAPPATGATARTPASPRPGRPAPPTTASPPRAAPTSPANKPPPLHLD